MTVNAWVLFPLLPSKPQWFHIKFILESPAGSSGVRCDPAPCQRREQPALIAGIPRCVRHACSVPGAWAASRYQNIPPCAAEGGGRLRQPEKRVLPRGLSPCLGFAAPAPPGPLQTELRPTATRTQGAMGIAVSGFAGFCVASGGATLRGAGRACPLAAPARPAGPAPRRALRCCGNRKSRSFFLLPALLLSHIDPRPPPLRETSQPGAPAAAPPGRPRPDQPAQCLWQLPWKRSQLGPHPDTAAGTAAARTRPCPCTAGRTSAPVRFPESFALLCKLPAFCSFLCPLQPLLSLCFFLPSGTFIPRCPRWLLAQALLPPAGAVLKLSVINLYLLVFSLSIISAPAYSTRKNPWKHRDSRLMINVSAWLWSLVKQRSIKLQLQYDIKPSNEGFAVLAFSVFEGFSQWDVTLQAVPNGIRSISRRYPYRASAACRRCGPSAARPSASRPPLAGSVGSALAWPPPGLGEGRGKMADKAPGGSQKPAGKVRPLRPRDTARARSFGSGGTARGPFRCA